MIIIFLLFLLLYSPVYGQGVAVVQSAAPTSNGGTQDFTSPGFGTPSCAIFFLSYGTVAGTAATHGLLSIGVSNFTTTLSVAAGTESTSGNTDTGAVRDATALVSLQSTDQSIDGTATASTITDGARLTWADAPPAAYLGTAVLFNSSMFSNCTVGSLTPSASLNGTASVSGLGWQPDFVFGITSSALTSARPSFGFAVSNAGITQYAVSMGSTTAQATSDFQSRVTNNRIIYSANDAGGNYEVTSFDSGGFTLTTRDATGSITDVYYIAAKYASGASAKITSCNSPTATGSHSCTGAGFTPTAAIMGHANPTAVNTTSTSSSNSETFGISAFTAAASGSSMLWQDDASATTTAESMTDTKAVNLRKESASYMVGTLTGFQSDGADFDYTVTDGSAHVRFILFLKGVATQRPRSSPIFFQ